MHNLSATSVIYITQCLIEQIYKSDRLLSIGISFLRLATLWRIYFFATTRYFWGASLTIALEEKCNEQHYKLFRVIAGQNAWFLESIVSIRRTFFAGFDIRCAEKLLFTTLSFKNYGLKHWDEATFWIWCRFKITLRVLQNWLNSFFNQIRDSP